MAQCSLCSAHPPTHPSLTKHPSLPNAQLRQVLVQSVAGTSPLPAPPPTRWALGLHFRFHTECGVNSEYNSEEHSAVPQSRVLLPSYLVVGGGGPSITIRVDPTVPRSLSPSPPSHTAHTATHARKPEQLVVKVMEVSVRHAGTGDSCVIGVAEGGTVVGLKADALNEMFPDSINNAAREAACVAAHIEECEEELDDAQRVADTGLEDGGAVKLVPRWPNLKAPAVYITQHGESAQCITLSRCGTLCAVGYDNGHITVFDTTTADVVADFTHGGRVISCTPFSVCGTWLATGSCDGTICVWLTSTWEQVCILHDDDCSYAVWNAAWTRCERLVSGDAQGKVRVWDLKGTPSATVLEGHSKVVCSIAVSGTRIFSGSADKTIRVWDISTLTHTHTLDDHTDVIMCMALTQDEQHPVSCSRDRSLKVWCTTSLSCLRTVQLDELSFSVAVSQPGDVVAMKGFLTTTLSRLSTGEYLGKVDSDGAGVALSPCGRWVFTATNFSCVSVFDVSSFSP